MQTDPATKMPRLLTLPTYDDLASGNLARAAVGPRTLTLKPRNQKPKSISEFQQAGPGACWSIRTVAPFTVRRIWT